MADQGAANDTGEQGRDQTDKVSGQGPGNTGRTPTGGGTGGEGTLSQANLGEESIAGVQGSEAPSMSGGVGGYGGGGFDGDQGRSGQVAPEDRGVSERMHADTTLHGDRQNPVRAGEENRSFDGADRPTDAPSGEVSVSEGHMGRGGDPVEGAPRDSATGRGETESQSGR